MENKPSVKSPGTFILYRRPQSDPKFVGRAHNEVWIPQELTRQRDDVRLSFYQYQVRLLCRRDQSNSADADI